MKILKNLFENQNPIPVAATSAHGSIGIAVSASRAGTTKPN